MQYHYIGNASVPTESGRTIPVLDPSDGQAFDELQRGSPQDIDLAVRSARECQDSVWSKLSAAERGRLLMRLSGSVLQHADRKSTRLNSSHLVISYAVFCLKKKRRIH